MPEDTADELATRAAHTAAAAARDARGAVVAVAAVAMAMAWLSWHLPAETFAVGDSGVKLVATRNALAHPRAPLEIPLPRVGVEAMTAVDPFFVVHGDHSHATTGPLLPILTAPLLGLAGARGLYVLPGLGFLVWVAGWAAIARDLDPSRSATATAVVAALSTPVFFYGLEFWDHAPALGLAAIATRSLITSASASSWPTARAAGAGVLFGLATLFRPELACSALVAMAILPARLQRARLPVILACAAGAAFAAAPFLAYNWNHFGSPLGAHVGVNLGLLTTDWWRSRLHIAAQWFLRPDTANLFRVAPVLMLLALGSVGTGRRGRALMFVLAALTTVLTLAIAPNDGGSQWGPRYLLPVYGPLVVLASDGLARLPARRTLAGVLVAALLVMALAGQRQAYRELRGAKRAYAQILSFIRAEVPPGSVVVTDLWWLDQVAAAATAERVMLFAPDPAREEAVREAIVRSQAGSAFLIRSYEESTLDERGWQPPCYTAARRRELAIRALTLVAYRVGCRP